MSALAERVLKKKAAKRQNKYYSKKKSDPEFRARRAAIQKQSAARKKKRESLDQDAIRNLNRELHNAKYQLQKTQAELDTKSAELEQLKLDFKNDVNEIYFSDSDTEESDAEFDDMDELEHNNRWNGDRVTLAMDMASKGKTVSKRRTGFEWTEYKKLETLLIPYFQTTTLNGKVSARRRSIDDKLTTKQQIFLTINYFKNYPTFGAMAFEFSLPQKYIR